MSCEPLRPFWNYYGGKSKNSDFYPAPDYDTIVEPFCGAAGYSIRYYRKRVILFDMHPKVAATWEYLINTPSEEIRKLPIVTNVADLPTWVPEGARYLIGFNMNTGIAEPANRLSKVHRENRELKDYESGWGEPHRELCAWQADLIRHWKITQGDYTIAPDVEATWFIDPPYANSSGRQYRFHDVDYPALGEWCRARKGQVMVCENEGATWLPFDRWLTAKPSINKGAQMKEQRSREAMWTNHPEFDVSVLPSGRLRVRL